jgi:hypothetical protein
MKRLGLAALIASMTIACGSGSSDPGDGTPSCGTLDQSCCASGAACTTGLSCVSGTCETTPVVCGGVGDVCCSSAPACSTGLTCASGTCQDPYPNCGASGQPCCAAIVVCDPGLTCLGTDVCGVPPPPACNDPYREAPGVAVNAYVETTVTGDVDADGDLDIVACSRSTGLFVLRNGGSGNFTSSAVYALACSMALVADFTEDGKADVVVSSKSNSVILMTGPGPSTTGWRSFATGNGSLGMAAADLNGDAHLDLVVANETDDTISVLLGNGDGTFAAKVDYVVDPGSVADKPVGVAIGDLNGDSYPDVAVVGRSMGYVGVFLNTGTGGTLGTMTQVTTGSTALEVAITDLDSDGTQDLIVPRSSGNYVDVLLGTGGGAFAAPVPLEVGLSNWAVGVGDLDGDATPDIVTLSYESNALSVLLAQGGGAFAPAVRYGVGRGSDDLALGDFDGDGDLDVAVAGFTEREVQVFTNDGTGRIAAAPIVTTATAPDAVIAARLDADAFPDLVYVTRASNSATVLLGMGNGRFAAPATLTTGTTPVALAAGDFNADGALDLVTANAGGTVSILTGGDGTFAAKVDLTVATDASYLAVGDFDGDLDDDILLASSADAATYLVRSNGDGTFQSPVVAATKCGPLAVADLDGDGHLDFAVRDLYTYYVLGGGDGTFAAPANKWMADAFALGNVDAGLGPDVVELSAASLKIETWLKGTGTTYTYAGSRLPAPNFTGLALPDADGDGFADIASVGDFVAVDLGLGDGYDRARATYGAGYVPKNVLAADLDNDGRDDLVIGSADDRSLRVLMSVCP